MTEAIIKIFRILGKRGRITIPYEIRKTLGFAYNDVLSFSVFEDNAVLVRREKICNGCREIDKGDGSGVKIGEFLDGLPSATQREALIHLLSKERDGK